MRIVSFGEIGAEAWDDFCLKSDFSWLRHTSRWLDYSNSMRFENSENQNLSFGVVEDGGLTAIAPLLKEKIYSCDERFEFGFAGLNNPFPAFSSDVGERHREKAAKYIFSEIDRLAVEHKIDYASFEISPLIPAVRKGVWSVNPLQQLGFHDTQISTHVVCLEKSGEELFSDCRKGHKSDIKYAVKSNALVKVLDALTITKGDFQLYRDIHFRAAGRQTRPDRTWELIYEWIEKGFAVLALYFSDDMKCLAAALSIVYKDGACYGSGCVLPEFNNERGIMHLALWETMQSLKKKGIRWYETGWQYAPTISQEVASGKEMNISLFKRGFGGVNVPYFRGEKFYDYDYLEQVLLGRIKKLREINSV